MPPNKYNEYVSIQYICREVFIMKDEKQTFIQWVKAHKKELIIAGISVSSIICLIVGIKKREAILDLWKSLQEQLHSCSAVPLDNSNDKFCEAKIIEFPLKKDSVASIEVREHVRNLPDGWNASMGKILSAKEHGYQLEPGQTWVDTYKKMVL